jgi:hypothetical protein
VAERVAAGESSLGRLARRHQAGHRHDLHTGLAGPGAADREHQELVRRDRRADTHIRRQPDLLDQTLRDSGPDAGNARKLLHDYTARAIEDQWPQETGQRVRMEDSDSWQLLHDARLAIVELPATDPYHQALRGSALVLMDGILETRWLLIERAESSIQPVFLVILIAWIVLIFVSFGYNAPRNATVVSAFFICSIALAACLFIITEMDTPFDGLIVISSHAMRDALSHMSQ